MLKRTLTCILTLAAIAAAPTAAGAADTVVVPGVDAPRMTALDGTVVWIAGRYPSQTLMQRSADGTVAAVAGAPAATYRSIDLGHDGSGDLVLTYIRCKGSSACRGFSDDLDGRRVSFKRLAPKRCELSAAPARWGSRIAYGLTCETLTGRRAVDLKRSGLFVRSNAGAPKRLRLPRDAVKFGADRIAWVDLRGTMVGAGAADIYSYAFTQTVDAKYLRSDFVAASEGDGDAQIVGQALGTGGVLWTLVDSLHAGDPNLAVISRIVDLDCTEEYESLENPPGPAEADRYRAEAMAVDGATVYLYVPGTGIVTHEYAPTHHCG
jgi:hypothetical protein